MEQRIVPVQFKPIAIACVINHDEDAHGIDTLTEELAYKGPID